jgi:DNA-directed RNA polymerase specialized sigma24 family protein
MVYFDGANYAEASAAMGWSVNDTRVRLSLALKQIKVALAA